MVLWILPCRFQFRIRGFHPFPPDFPDRSPINPESIMQSEPRRINPAVWALSLSLAATKEIDVSFSSSGYLDVSVPRVPSHTLCIHVWVRKVFLRRFPHSEICGSMDICSLPQLIAAYHVFRRLSVPRHPPYALYSLTFKWCIALHHSVFGWFLNLGLFLGLTFTLSICRTSDV